MDIQAEGAEGQRLGGVGTGSAAKPPAQQTLSEEDPSLVRRRLLDDLFGRLRKSGTDREADGLARAIERVWFNSGSDTVDLLMARAVQAEHAHHVEAGVRILAKVVEIEPDWAEGWNELALARALSNDESGAMVDLAHVLAIEPRHFGALAGVGAILLHSGDKKGALEVFRRALALDPHLGAIKTVVDRLTIQVEGRDL